MKSRAWIDLLSRWKELNTQASFSALTDASAGTETKVEQTTLAPVLQYGKLGMLPSQVAA